MCSVTRTQQQEVSTKLLLANVPNLCQCLLSFTGSCCFASGLKEALHKHCPNGKMAKGAWRLESIEKSNNNKTVNFSILEFYQQL